jgi:hypothetical protein
VDPDSVAADEMTPSVDRFERRLGEEAAGLRVEMAKQGADLRSEMARQGADLRNEIAQQGADLRNEIARQGADLRREIVQQGADLRSEMAALRVALKTDLRNGFTHVAGEFALLRREMSSMREQMARDQFELLKWSFLFWVGQFFAVAALMVTMLRLVTPGR